MNNIKVLSPCLLPGTYIPFWLGGTWRGMAARQQQDNNLIDISLQTSCNHYIRRCALVSPCCRKIYWCRLCHDEAESGHEIDRKMVNRIKCCQCGLIQGVAPRCISCRIQFGMYYCELCRLFDDNDKGQFHCYQCGICRIGGPQNFQHCTQCDICFQIGSSHKCIEKCSRSNCPICLEDLHSHGECQKLHCGHMMHVGCFRQLKENYQNRCPLCYTVM